MKTITLTLNEALVLIAEGMTMNNVKTLANKLRNADAPVATVSTEKYDLEKAKAQSKTWEQSYHDAIANLDVAKQNLKLANQQVYDYERDLEKAKQTENTLRAEISNLENYAKQDDESLKYFRKWVEKLRVVLDCDKGLMTDAVFSQAIEMIKDHNQTVEALNKGTLHLIKANDVIAAVKSLYDEPGYASREVVMQISRVVENYYRGN